MTNLDSIFKSRDIALPRKVHPVKAMVFPVVMYRYESWTEESWAPKNWCFWTVVLDKTLESPLDCKETQPDHPKGDQSWVFIGRTDINLATWCEELTQKDPAWCWEGLGAGVGDDRGWDGWMSSPTRWTWVWVNSRSWWWTGIHATIHGVAKSRTRLSDWTEVRAPCQVTLEAEQGGNLVLPVLIPPPGRRRNTCRMRL